MKNRHGCNKTLETYDDDASNVYNNIFMIELL